MSKDNQNVPGPSQHPGKPGAEYEDEKFHEMTASYSEISMDSQSSPDISNSPEIFRRVLEPIPRPTRLELRGIDRFEQNTLTYENSIGVPELEGTITKDGDVVSFVAEDLESKIKLSSPMSGKDFLDSRSSFSSSHRQSSIPPLLPVDQNILNEMEIEARKVATSVDALTENLAAILHSASALTVSCLETYRDAVCKTCDGIDSNIKSMYQLMAKCEELSKSMSSMHKMAEKLKNMKKMLDIFESSMN